MIVSCFLLVCVGVIIALVQYGRGPIGKVVRPTSTAPVEQSTVSRRDDAALQTAGAGEDEDGSSGVSAGKSVGEPAAAEAGKADVERQEERGKVKLTLFFSDKEGYKFVAEERVVTKGDKSLPELAIEELIKGPQKKDLVRTIPEGTRLNSLRVENGTAFVDFSKEIVENHWGGSTGEIMTIGSIANTLTFFEGIERVQILVDGEMVESLAGHYYLMEPVEAIAF